MSEPADKRGTLHDALRRYVLAPWRVHRYSPATLVAPCVFIDSPTLELVGGLVNVVFPVVIISDGAVHAQVTALDELLARVWTAAATVGQPVAANPVALDVGGPSLRAQVMNVECTVAAHTLCPPDLTLSA